MKGTLAYLVLWKDIDYNVISQKIFRVYILFLLKKQEI